MLKPKTLIYLLLFIFLIVAIVTGVSLVSQQRPVSPRLKAAGSKVKVFFLPITGTTVSKSFDVRVNLDTQGQTIENPDLILVFDKPIDFIASQSSWGSILKPKGNLGFVFDKSAQKLSLLGEGSFSGSGNLATIRLKKESPGPLTIKVSNESFSPNLSFEEASAIYNIL